MFMECKTYRWLEHVGPEEDFEQGYRNRSEFLAWQKNDQLLRLENLVEEGKRKIIDKDIENRIKAAIEFAEKSEFPSREELEKHVFA